MRTIKTLVLFTLFFSLWINTSYSKGSVFFGVNETYWSDNFESELSISPTELTNFRQYCQPESTNIGLNRIISCKKYTVYIGIAIGEQIDGLLKKIDNDKSLTILKKDEIKEGNCKRFTRLVQKNGKCIYKLIYQNKKYNSIYTIDVQCSDLAFAQTLVELNFFKQKIKCSE